MHPSAARSVPYGQPASPRAPLMLSVGAQPHDVVMRLQRTGLFVTGPLPWGSESACAALLERRPPMIVLSAPDKDAETLTRLIKAAARIAPVAVLRPGGSDAVAAFDAGACDVLDPDAPTAELAWRIRADLRRCPPVLADPDGPTGTASQRLLLDVLSRARSAVCCHHLRLLLGTPDLPMTLRALRARLQRLLPSLTDQGLELVVDQQWGLATYHTRKTC
ncbi:hypothetical protein [Streptomyces sp. NPDC008092]|uniref:hypothetical protein n=1 Tax=Streptomyces sp. NPDC008092 TaxID=3364808 RepID=UPI0036DFCB1D